jgi:hypothetical protein
VRQLRGNAGLASESLASLRIGREIGPENLDRHKALEGSLPCEEDTPGRTTSKRAEDLVLTRDRALQCHSKRGFLSCDEGRRGSCYGVTDAGEAVCLVDGGEQRLHLALHRNICPTSLGNECRALGGRCLHGRAGNGLHFGPALRRHCVPSSRRSHARAIAHSRLTVAGETSSASAVSSILSPPK